MKSDQRCERHADFAGNGPRYIARFFGMCGPSAYLMTAVRVAVLFRSWFAGISPMGAIAGKAAGFEFGVNRAAADVDKIAVG
jgi:hypothetical protein